MTNMYQNQNLLAITLVSSKELCNITLSAGTSNVMTISENFIRDCHVPIHGIRHAHPFSCSKIQIVSVCLTC